MKDQFNLPERNDVTTESEQVEGTREVLSKQFSDEQMSLFPRTKEIPSIDFERILGNCSIGLEKGPRMSQEEIDKSIKTIADVVGKKGDFGNAFQREELKSTLEEAQRRGTLDKVLQDLNVQIKKTNSDLTISWNTTIDRDSDESKKTDIVVNLVSATTGKIEDQAKVNIKEEGPCRVVEPKESYPPFPRRWGKDEFPRLPGDNDFLIQKLKTEDR